MLEKLTKEIHVVIQKYRNKNLEKTMVDKFEILANDNKAFRDLQKQKILDINNTIEQKCKKFVMAVYESKIAKLESDLRSMTETLPMGMTHPLNNKA